MTPSFPTLHMIGHAGMVIDFGETVVWTDPWLTSTVFNDSWEIHPEPCMTDQLMARLTHIWISHEHPDHFNVPTLRSIPAHIREQVTVLTQTHRRRDVYRFLNDAGFNVSEMPSGVPVQMPGCELTCIPIGHEDSALVARNSSLTILNLNDCKPDDRTLAKIVERHGPVDVMLDQFSGAGWNGNPDDTGRKQAQARLIRETFERHLNVVDPRWVIPFASFVRFCHAESSHLAAERVTLAEIATIIGPARLAVMYPGDVWSTHQAWDGNGSALARYQKADRAVSSIPLVVSDPVDADDVIAAAHLMVDRLHQSFHPLLLRAIPAVRFAVSDGGPPICDLTISMPDGVSADGTVPASTTVHLGSQAAWYTFAHRWGMSTLLISGRFSIEGPEQPFMRLKQFGAAEAAGFGSRGRLSHNFDARTRAILRREVLNTVRRRRFPATLPSVLRHIRGRVIAPFLRRYGDRITPPIAGRVHPRVLWMRHLASWWRPRGKEAELVDSRELLWALAQPENWHGDYLEFGVFEGESLRWWCSHASDKTRLFGFDTFTGLPENWGNQPAGSYSAAGNLPAIDDGRIEYVVGLFGETVEKFLERTELRHELVVHLDADLYSSTLEVLEALVPLLRTGDVIIFDQILDVGTADQEFRAFLEVSTRSQLRYEMIGAVRAGRQAAIRIK